MPGLDSLALAVASGLGVGVIPESLVPTLTAGDRLIARPLSGTSVAASVTVVCRLPGAAPAHATRFLEIVQQSFLVTTAEGETSHV